MMWDTNNTTRATTLGFAASIKEHTLYNYISKFPMFKYIRVVPKYAFRLVEAQRLLQQFYSSGRTYYLREKV